MKALVRKLRDDMRRRALASRCVLDIAPTAKIVWSGLLDRPPANFAVGAGSMFNGVIAADHHFEHIEAQHRARQGDRSDRQRQLFGLRDTDLANPPTQLYLISPLDVGGDFPARLERALAAGKGPKSQLVAAFQFRVKGVGDHEAAALAEPLQAICAAHDVAFIVNDSVALAKRLKADGVHLGQDDGSPRDAREELGREAQIGVTCHASRHRAMDAGEAGADYVAFGAFYPSTTKDIAKDRGSDAEQPDIELLQWWSTVFEIPCVAIGGITPENCRPLVEAGADFIAVSGAVWAPGSWAGAGADEAAAVQAFAKAIAAAR